MSTLGSRVMNGVVAAQFQAVAGLYDQARGPHADRLVKLMAEYAQFLAWMAQDQDNATVALGWFDRSYDWALESGHGDMAATTLEHEGTPGLVEHAGPPLCPARGGRRRSHRGRARRPRPWRSRWRGAGTHSKARRRGERKRFSSAILPPWCRKSPKISEVLPPLFLHGLSSGDFVPALEQFLGSSAGLSPATVTRLTQQWQADHQAFGQRDLSGNDYVYVWADGIHLRICLREAKSCVLVLMGVRADGTKELIAMSGGYRESADSWADLLRDCQRRGTRAPVLAFGDGALGFWKALTGVFPETRHQRCWVHKIANVANPAEVGPARGEEGPA